MEKKVSKVEQVQMHSTTNNKPLTTHQLEKILGSRTAFSFLCEEKKNLGKRKENQMFGW